MNCSNPGEYRLSSAVPISKTVLMKPNDAENQGISHRLILLSIFLYQPNPQICSQVHFVQTLQFNQVNI